MSQALQFEYSMCTLAYHVLNWGMDIEATWDATIMLQNRISSNRLQDFDAMILKSLYWMKIFLKVSSNVSK
jgi:hypothetical protein